MTTVIDSGDVRSMGLWPSLRAEEDPDTLAITMGDASMTRRAFDRAANRLARDLTTRGVGVGDRVAIVLPTSPQHQITAFALWKIGATPVALPPYAVDAEMVHLLDLAAPKLVVGLGEERAGGRIVLPIDHVPDATIDDSPLPECLSPVWKAVPSGGSTGLPKLIFDHNPSVFDPAWGEMILKIRRDDVMLHPAPAHHNSPFCQTAFALCSGAHVVLMPRFDAEEWLRLVERHRIRWAYMVPTMMSRVLALPEQVRLRYDLSSLEVVFHMAAPCPEWVKAAWIDWLGPEKIWEIYGGTEGYGGASISGVEWLAHRGSVGRPAGLIEIRDEDGAPLPHGDIGMVYFGSVTDADGEANGVTQWRTLGDMGSLDEDGYLYLADRRTDVILTGGVNLYPAEIEGVISSHPAIACAIVIGMPDDDLGARAHALIELRPGATPPHSADLFAFLRERLSWNKVPYTYELVARPLRDDAGKARRSALRAERMGGQRAFMLLR